MFCISLQICLTYIECFYVEISDIRIEDTQREETQEDIGIAAAAGVGGATGGENKEEWQHLFEPDSTGQVSL